jgi:hypothetical protein
MTRLVLPGLLLVLAGCGSTSSPAPRVVSVAGQLHQPGAPVVRAHVRVVPVPVSAESEAKGDGLVHAAGASCGRERWAVKTATDPAAASIRLEPKNATVAELDALPTTNSGNPDQGREPNEMQVYRVTANLEVAKLESDSDLHLVLTEGSATMIGEIPDAPACTGPPVTERVSVLEQQIEQARNAFVQEFGQPGGSFMTIGHRVTVTGVLFDDKLHGQRGVSPSGVELHPILSIEDP